MWRLTRHRGKWSLTWDEGGRTFRISTGTADRGLAESRARELWDARTKPKSERIEDIWPAYVASRKEDGVNTKRHEYIWNALEPHFGYRIGSAISREDCRAYYKARKLTGVSDSTIRTELALLRACLGYQYGKGNTTVWLPPAAAPRVRWLSKDQVRAVLAACETPHIELFITLAISTGARAGAICDLTWDRVDFGHNTISFMPPGRIKTNKGRTIVPMNANARTALETAYKGRLTDNVIEFRGKPVASVKKALEKLSTRTGIEFSAHVFRHTCAVWMAQDDIPMQKIAQYLGHTKTDVTEAVYARYSPSFMKDASAAVSW